MRAFDQEQKESYNPSNAVYNMVGSSVPFKPLPVKPRQCPPECVMSLTSHKMSCTRNISILKHVPNCLQLFTFSWHMGVANSYLSTRCLMLEPTKIKIKINGEILGDMDPSPHFSRSWASSVL